MTCNRLPLVYITHILYPFRVEFPIVFDDALNLTCFKASVYEFFYMKRDFEKKTKEKL